MSSNRVPFSGYNEAGVWVEAFKDEHGNILGAEAACEHSWRFDGDDPRIMCFRCGEVRDAISGRVIPNRVRGHYYFGRVRVNIQDGPLETPCHVWQGTVDGQGYAKRGHSGEPHTNAHRDVYQLEHGRIAGDVVVHHRCEDKLCVNVDHLETLTRADHVVLHRGRTFSYEDAAALAREGIGATEIGRRMGVGKSAVQAAFKRMKARGEL